MTKVIESFPLSKKAGEVGIEIEVEGGRSPVPEVSNRYWRTVMDGSLRGYSAEYVLISPVKRKEITKVLNNLAKEWAINKVAFAKSPRTSTHIHINMQENNWNEVISFFVLYMIFEDLFVRFCGREREGNLFCLRGRDAEWMIEQVLLISSRGNWSTFADNNLRYASLNMASLSKFGSMEFRAMRGTTDFAQIKLWINMLLRLKDHALEYDNPRNILELFSQTGEAKFLEEIMGDYAEVLQCPQMRRMIREGVWRVQELAYTPVRDIRSSKRKPKASPRSIEDMLNSTAEGDAADTWGTPMPRLGMSLGEINQQAQANEELPEQQALAEVRSSVEARAERQRRARAAPMPIATRSFTTTYLSTADGAADIQTEEDE